jgi:hypothetical protein
MGVNDERKTQRTLPAAAPDYAVQDIVSCGDGWLPKCDSDKQHLENAELLERTV